MIASLRRSILALVAAASLAGAAHADAVELHGGARAVDGSVVRTGADGIEVRVRRDGLESTLLTPWSEVRSVRGGAERDAAAWVAAGNELWRARLRVRRGDWPLALEPLERAFATWKGAAPSRDGLLAAVGCAEARIRAGRAADAVAPAFEALRLVRAGAALDPSDDSLAGALARVTDPAVPLPPALPPGAFAGDDAARVRASLAAFDARGDEGLAAAVAAYAGAVEGGTPRAPAKAGTKLDAPANLAASALDALRGASAPSAAERGAALSSLARLRRSMPTWFDAWARFAAGRALAADADATLRDRGRVLLASLVACDARAAPTLASRADAERRRPTVAAPEGGTLAGPPLLGQPRPEVAVPSDRSDATAAWLEAQGEPDLLLAHLEAQLDQAADAPDRAVLVARIAQILAARLEREDDETRRNALLARALGLVRRNPDGAEPLRLAILRAQHRAAQRTAEDRRAGKGTDAECTAALEEFRTLVREFGALAVAGERARASANRDASAEVGTRAEDTIARAGRAEELARNSQFFRAWALYYSAWLSRELGHPDWRAQADEALRRFAELLEPGRAAIDPSEVSEDLRGNEGFASAILGSGLSASLVQTGATADAWLALLESPRTNLAVRARLPSWRMASCLDRGDLAAALALLKSEGDGPQGVTMALIAAARAGRMPDADGAAELLTEAVGRLASSGRLRDLSVIAVAPGAEPTGAGARLFAAVRASAEANRLREAGDAAGAESAWQRAAGELEGALGPDAPPSVAAGARSLRGHVLRGAGRLAEAADAFADAAKSLSGDRAGDARWMAVLCLEEAARRPGAPAEVAARRDALVASIVADLPATAAAVRARAWRATRSDLPSTADIEALLDDRVPMELAPAARRAALEGLYRRFRATQGDERRAAARRALLAGDDVALGGGDEGTLDLRRRLEMSVAIGDRTRAADSLAALESRAASMADPGSMRDEILARRVQVACVEGRLDDAQSDLAAIDPAGPWARVAAHALLAEAQRVPGTVPTVRAAAARAVCRAAAVPASADIATWLRAEAEILRAGGTGVDRDGAARAAAEALKAAPGSADLLLADAEFRAASGDAAASERSLRAVLSAAPAGSETWLLAKAMQVEAIAAADPGRARALLEQVRRIGGFGSGEALARFERLDAQLPAAGTPRGVAR